MSPETVLILCLLALTVALGAISLFLRWLDYADENLERQDREDRW